MVRLLLQKIRSIKIKTFWGGLIIGFVLAHVFWIMFGFISEKIYQYKNRPSETANNLTNISLPSPTPTPTPLPIVLSSDSIFWLDKPINVPRLDVFKTQTEIDKLLIDSYGGPPDISKFYFVKIANLSDNSALIRGYLPKQSYYGVEYINFIVNENKIKAILDKASYLNYAEDLLSSKVQIVYGRIDGLTVPETLLIGNTSFYQSNIEYPSFEDFDKLNSPTKFSTTEFGPVYVVYSHTTAPAPLFDRIFYLKLKDGTALRYTIGDKSTRYDNNVQKFTWIDNTVNDISFRPSPFWAGCGGESDSSVQVVKISDVDSLQKIVVGTDANNNQVYQLTDPSSPILKKAYSEYSDSRGNNQDGTLISYEAFLKDKSNILIKDSFGDWVFYLNPDYAQLAECGKPVIYLYPTQKENVNVKVGANITKSDPNYTNGGWNVTAYPDGRLIYNGSSYPYLFWEGKGNGPYPNVATTGVVVERKNVEIKLKSDLIKQGLNDKEISDFLSFWLPKIPNKPFIKITWLNNPEMDILAPITVTPKPDTTIRVFLDFQGLDNPVELIPQKLFAPKRVGFTLVEWGGLLVK